MFKIVTIKIITVFCAHCWAGFNNEGYRSYQQPIDTLQPFASHMTIDALQPFASHITIDALQPFGSHMTIDALQPFASHMNFDAFLRVTISDGVVLLTVCWQHCKCTTSCNNSGIAVACINTGYVLCAMCITTHGDTFVQPLLSWKSNKYYIF